MKRRLKLFFLLIVIIMGTFTFANSLFSLTASATYVEGVIDQDTIWTLIDSPFVVSKNITVNPGVTLTIEPGVEVRFGGNFPFIVAGRLNATGTKDHTITFTSNKDQPEAGDWKAIEFSGTEPSILVYCFVRYAKNGTTIENGNVEIINSEIGNNLQNGITIENSTVEIRNTVISNNAQSGIYLTGENQVTIQNNTIRSNADGIILTGNSTSGVNISQNNVLSNTQSGIKLDTDNADYYNDIVILDNILSANNYGFYVSGNASTYITRNYISYSNSTGIFYQKGNNHVAYFNDIYGNNRGMDVSSNANVTAEYNYWGDESGPYHTSLNPAGKGNSVGGDGVNLDFIFFLTAPVGYINERPIARLLTDKTLVSPDQTVMFIATTSSDDRHVDQYFLDFGDGSNSSWITLSIFVHKYSAVETYYASLTVMDDFGVTSSNSAVMTIDVQNLTPLEVSITLSNYTTGYGEQVSITAYVTDGTNPIENANVTLFSVKGGSFMLSSGLTNSTGHFTTTFTSPNVTEISDIGIFATASKAGYADGSDYKYIKVLPTLSVQVTVEPTKIKSEESATVTVLVTHDEQPIADADVTVSSDSGNFSATTGITGSEGNATFVFSAPQTTTLLNITITVNATKPGYIEAQKQTTLTVEPKILVVEVAAEPVTLTSEAVSQVTVHVTHEGTPISNVTVNISSDSGGNFSATTGITDSSGNVAFAFTAPQVNTPLNLTITANATKTGYISGENQIVMTITPEPTPETVGGLPLTTILIILIPIVMVAIVAILIKLKVISITLKETL